MVGPTAHDRDEPCPGPDPDPRPPARFTVPAGAVDTHAHVIGEPSRHRFVEERSYTPPPASGDDYVRMLDATGMTFGVLVQVSVHGTDNTLLLDTLAAHPTSLRGVAVAPPDLPDTTWSELHDAGIRGLRLSTLMGGAVGLDNLDRYEALCAELGWHLQFFIDAERLSSQDASRLAKLRVPAVLDHLGHVSVSAGLDSRGMQLMLSLLRDGAWTKLSAAYRLAEQPPYGETIPFARALIEAAPDRCVWGSDWPHPAMWGSMPNVGDLLDLLADWAPDEAVRNRILVDNAHALYGFPTKT